MVVGCCCYAMSVTLAALAGISILTWSGWVKGAAFWGSFGDGENKAKRAV